MVLFKEPDMSDLSQVLATVNDRWCEIGTALDVGTHVLRGLERNESEDTMRLIKVLEEWRNSCCSVTWKRIIKVLEGPIVNRRAQSIEIKKFLSTLKKRLCYFNESFR